MPVVAAAGALTFSLRLGICTTSLACSHRRSADATQASMLLGTSRSSVLNAVLNAVLNFMMCRCRLNLSIFASKRHHHARRIHLGWLLDAR